jgi:hypothetical protein
MEKQLRDVFSVVFGPLGEAVIEILSGQCGGQISQISGWSRDALAELSERPVSQMGRNASLADQLDVAVRSFGPESAKRHSLFTRYLGVLCCGLIERLDRRKSFVIGAFGPLTVCLE